MSLNQRAFVAKTKTLQTAWHESRRRKNWKSLVTHTPYQMVEIIGVIFAGFNN
jgi:hypothetical protein